MLSYHRADHQYFNGSATSPTHLKLGFFECLRHAYTICAYEVVDSPTWEFPDSTSFAHTYNVHRTSPQRPRDARPSRYWIAYTKTFISYKSGDSPSEKSSSKRGKHTKVQMKSYKPVDNTDLIFRLILASFFLSLLFFNDGFLKDLFDSLFHDCKDLYPLYFRKRRIKRGVRRAR